MKVLVLTAFVLFSVSCGAQESAQFKACMQKEMSQNGMDRCASEEYSRADRDLNTVYQRLLAKVRLVQGAAEKTKHMEQAWIAYRDGYIEAMYPSEDKQAAYGTIYPMNVDLALARLTRMHAKDLENLIDEFDGGEQ